MALEHKGVAPILLKMEVSPCQVEMEQDRREWVR